MNERIKELARMSGFKIDETESFSEFAEKTRLDCFAELIVSECVKVAMRSVSDDEPKEAWYLIQEHFGVRE